MSLLQSVPEKCRDIATARVGGNRPNERHQEAGDHDPRPREEGAAGKFGRALLEKIVPWTTLTIVAGATTKTHL
jgi:hypothetical protein